ncbi:modification methylase [Bifidobacterium anseris]|uniref:Cytosine-specific methyltransferase n=2 Tax=Bifidobacterium anseris TaxID=2020963 RepID=A0A2N5IXB3_9BIFI|nr:modification methylase [Bifidobacterium anseris]
MGVSAGVVTRLANVGELEFDICGARKVFRQEAVDAYLRRNNLVRAPEDQALRGGLKYDICALSFFSGAGGLDLGMERAGIPATLYCENNRECRMTLHQNRPDVALLGDITQIDADSVRRMACISPNSEIDVIFGGPPCQAFSTAGARRAFEDPRGNVFLKYLDLAAELNPRYLIIENVRGLLSTSFPTRPGGKPVRGGAMRYILNRLNEMDYGVSFNLYNAANFGSAQIRERVVIIAKRDGTKCDWLIPTHADSKEKVAENWRLPYWMTFRDVVHDIEDLPQTYTNFPQKRLRYFNMLKEGQCWNKLPLDVQEEAMGKAFRLGGGKTGFYRRIAWDRPSPTLVTSPTMPATDLCHPDALRPLSVEEYKRVQGFPDDWWIAGGVHDQYRQIGNAVPVSLGEAIGRAILDDMNGRSHDKRWRDFPYSRYSRTSDLTWDLA